MSPRSRFALAALGATAVAAAPAAVMASTYVVRPGDTLTGIALRHGSSVQAIVDANQLGAPGRSASVSCSRSRTPRAACPPTSRAARTSTPAR